MLVFVHELVQLGPHQGTQTLFKNSGTTYGNVIKLFRRLAAGKIGLPAVRQHKLQVAAVSRTINRPFLHKIVNSHIDIGRRRKTDGTDRFVVIFAPDVLGQVGFNLYSGGNHNNNIPF